MEDIENKVEDVENKSEEHVEDQSRLDKEQVDLQKAKSESRVIQLKGNNVRFLDETGLYKLINKFSEQEFDVVSVYKRHKNNGGLVLFSSLEEKQRFYECFLDEKNLHMSKKISVRYDYEDESQVLQEGKKVKALKKNVEKQQKRYIPTYSEIQAELQITLKERMFPLIDLEYPKQVELKLEIFRGVMKNWFKQARNLLGGNKYLLPPWLQNEDGMPCEIKSFVECDEPNRLKYRNKVELTIGIDKDEVVRVGYNRGNAQKQIHLVEKAESNPMMTDEQLLIAQKLEEYVTQNLATLPYYDKSEYKGFWKYVQIKQSQRTKQISILIVYSDTGMEQSVLEKFRQDMVQLFMHDLKLNEYKIVSLGVTAQNNVSDNIDSDAKVDIIAGQDYYEEQILGKTFQVSQNSFLQINTPQCEKLYTLLSQILTDDG